MTRHLRQWRSTRKSIVASLPHDLAETRKAIIRAQRGHGPTHDLYARARRLRTEAMMKEQNR